MNSIGVSPHFSSLVCCAAAIIRPGCVTLRRPPRRTARVRLRGPRSQALPGRPFRRLATTSDEKCGLGVVKRCCSIDLILNTFVQVRWDQASRFPRARGRAGRGNPRRPKPGPPKAGPGAVTSSAGFPAHERHLWELFPGLVPDPVPWTPDKTMQRPCFPLRARVGASLWGCGPGSFQVAIVRCTLPRRSPRPFATLPHPGRFAHRSPVPSESG